MTEEVLGFWVIFLKLKLVLDFPCKFLKKKIYHCKPTSLGISSAVSKFYSEALRCA
jgi:hypothetical protein